MNIDSVLSFAGSYGMLERGDTVVVGLSGGADSVCLLSVLCELRERLGLSIIAAHVNHAIRGEQADCDEAFCKELCTSLKVPFEVLHADIPALSEKSGKGLEECGREVRYGFFASLAGESGKIATAHNMNDAVETLLFNITRGSGLKGAGSIPPVRGNIIRPLLSSTRAEIEQYLKEKSLSFVTDSTNSDTAYSRNKIRHGILPVLETINPDVIHSAFKFITDARQDEEYLSECASEQFKKLVGTDGMDAELLSRLPVPIKKRVVRLYLSGLTRADIQSKHIEDFLCFASSSGELQSAGGVRLVNRKGKISPLRQSAPAFEQTVSLCNGEISYAYGTLKIKVLEQKDLQFLNKELLEMCIDCDKICDSPILRSRKEGDRITLKKRGVTKTLKKLFNEDGIEPEIRNTVPVLDSDGTAVWVKGYGVNAPFAASDKTKKAVIISAE